MDSGGGVTEHTLTFSDLDSLTVNGSTVTSPYTLQNGDVIVATSPVGDKWNGYAIICNGELYKTDGTPPSISITNEDIVLSCTTYAYVDPTAAEAYVLTINYTA